MGGASDLLDPLRRAGGRGVGGVSGPLHPGSGNWQRHHQLRSRGGPAGGPLGTSLGGQSLLPRPQSRCPCPGNKASEQVVS